MDGGTRYTALHSRTEPDILVYYNSYIKGVSCPTVVWCLALHSVRGMYATWNKYFWSLVIRFCLALLRTKNIDTALLLYEEKDDVFHQVCFCIFTPWQNVIWSMVSVVIWSSALLQCQFYKLKFSTYNNLIMLCFGFSLFRFLFKFCFTLFEKYSFTLFHKKKFVSLQLSFV